jgi:hypothetical protein
MSAIRKSSHKPKGGKRAAKRRPIVKNVKGNEDVSEVAARLMRESEREDFSQVAVRIVSEERSE